MIDLDALKAELEASGLDPSGSWREWLVVGNITVYRRGAVYMSPGDEINQQDFRALAIIARHVAPIVTPEPDAEARDVLAEAIGENEGLRYGDHKDVWQHIDDDDKHWLRVVSDAGLAALRARGFAVVRTADVEAARDCARGMALECRGKPKDDYNALADRLQEAIR